MPLDVFGWLVLSIVPIIVFAVGPCVSLSLPRSEHPASHASDLERLRLRRRKPTQRRTSQEYLARIGGGK